MFCSRFSETLWIKRTTVQLCIYLKETKHYSQTKPVILKIPPNSEERLPVSDLSAHADRAESAFPGVLKTSWQVSQIQQLRSSFLQLLSRLLFLLYDLYFHYLVQALHVFLQRYLFKCSNRNQEHLKVWTIIFTRFKIRFSHGRHGDTNLKNQRNQNKVPSFDREWDGERYLSQCFDNA